MSWPGSHVHDTRARARGFQGGNHASPAATAALNPPTKLRGMSPDGYCRDCGLNVNRHGEAIHTNSCPTRRNHD